VSHRGKRRTVVAILARERAHGHYRVSARLSCGHTVWVQTHNRYRKGSTPVVGFCVDPECIMAEVEA
jgi:hypothetical protein